MTVVTDNPVHLNGLPNSTTLLEALLTDLAVEVGVLYWFLPRSETYWKTTIIRKWIPCRAAKQRVVFSSAASGS